MIVRRMGLLVLGIVAGLCPSARAEIRVLQVADSGAGLGLIGFVSKEVAAVVLGTAAQDYPLHVRKVSVTAGSALLSGHSGSGTMRIHIWSDNGAIEPGTRLFESPNPLSVSSGSNTFDVRSEGIVIASGNFRVGFEIVQEGADVFTDQSGRMAGRNFILGKQAGTADTFHWQESPSLVSGDFLISVEVETRYGDAGVAAPDAGMTADAGSSDAGISMNVDAGGAADAGISTIVDAGGAVDAGAGATGRDAGSGAAGTDGGLTGPARSGCRCGAAGEGALPWAAIALSGWLVLRRRTRCRRERNQPRAHR
jgi:hypothetical protein